MSITTYIDNVTAAAASVANASGPVAKTAATKELKAAQDALVAFVQDNLTDDNLAALGRHLGPTSAKRFEKLLWALQAKAPYETLKTVATATRVSTTEQITLPSGRYAHTSRGKDWCRKGAGSSVEWGSRHEDGFLVGPGTWTVGSDDGYNRKDKTTWKVESLRVGDQTWTIAN